MSQYLNDQASRLTDLAQQCDDPVLKDRLLELAKAWREHGETSLTLPVEMNEK